MFDLRQCAKAADRIELTSVVLGQDRRSTEALLTKVTHRPTQETRREGPVAVHLSAQGEALATRPTALALYFPQGPQAMSVQNAEVAAMFDQTADLLEIKGENQFRVRAYRRAARTIGGLPQSVRSMLAVETDLSELPGIGKDLAHKIADIVKTSRFELLESLKKKLPGEVGEMAALPGLGPKRIKLLYDKLKVRTLADLRRAIGTGRIHKLHGFGEATETKLAAALKKPMAAKRFKLATAEAEAEALVTYLRDGGRVVVAGSYRRRRDTIGDLDVLVTATIEEMAAAAQASGYEYMALTDHSRRVAMSHGLDSARVSRQIREIDLLNAKLKGFTILKGIEVDILKDGRLDLPDSALAQLDIVVAAVRCEILMSRSSLIPPAV